MKIIYKIRLILLNIKIKYTKRKYNRLLEKYKKEYIGI